MKSQLTEQGKLRVISDYLSGAGIAEIKKMYHISSETVVNLLEENNLVPRRRGTPFRAVSLADVDTIIELIERGFTVSEVCKMTEKSTYKIRQVLEFNGIKYDFRGRKKTTLTDEDIKSICERYSYGAHMQELASCYHIDIKRLRKILVDNSVEIRKPGRRSRDDK